MIEPNFEGVPERLQDCRQWVLWRNIQRDGRDTKIPWSVFDRPASSTDPETWHEFETVAIQYRPGYHAGIGFVFAEDDGFAGIDLDSCRNPETGVIAPWGQKWLDKADGYAEISPSGTGLKIWIQSEQKLDKGRNIKLEEEPLVPGKKPGIEIYTHGRYFAVTGHKIKDWQ